MSPRRKRASGKKKASPAKRRGAPLQKAPPAEKPAEVATFQANPIITLITDFGEGYYAGAVKGTILDICPQANIVDITHNISSHDVLEAAFTLLCSYPYYPKRSIHVVVVDPGVGSERRGIIVETKGFYFVGPDNGVLSFVYDRESVERVISIDARQYFRKQVSATFHGRDLFGPVAAWLARGTRLEQFGEEIRDYTGMAFLPIQQSGPNQVEGVVIHIDKFGNVITSISPEQVFELLGQEGTPRFYMNEREITCHYRFYAEAESDEIFSLVGSSGYYEIAAHRRPAAEILGVQRGEKIVLEMVR